MKFTRWIIVIGLLAGLIFGLHSYKTSLQAAASAQAASMPEPSATVNAVKAQSINFQKHVQVSGEVQAFQYIQLNNELAGVITKLNAPSGSIVEKGQVLLELDHRDENARLIAAQATLTLNEQTHARYIKLQQNNEISAEQVDKALAAVNIAKSEIAVLSTAISKKQLIAPFKGRIAIHTLEVGQYLDKNSYVFSLVGVHDFTWIDFHLPQLYQELTVGSKIQVTPMNQTTSYSAEIIAVDPQLSKQSRHLKYRAQIASKELLLKPNTLVTVHAPRAKQQRLTSVPDLAIKRDSLGTYVFLLNKDDNGDYRAQQTKVELGERQGDTVMITSGLEPGQLIASKGAFKLFPGMKVYIANDNSAQ